MVIGDNADIDQKITNLLSNANSVNFTTNRSSTAVRVGDITIGNNNPIVIQSMTSTDTADVKATVKQISDLVQAGSEVVRLTVNNEQAARAVPLIKEKLLAQNVNVPLVGCFHYNGHTLLSNYSELCQALAKYRINPGNVGFGNKRDHNFETIINLAIKYNRPVRIGVNWGSLDQTLITKLMDENAQKSLPKSAEFITQKALITSCLLSATQAEKIGLPAEKIILSCKVSDLTNLIKIYRTLAQVCNYPLHLGLTEAGMGENAMVTTTAALSILLNEGIGDTIRASLTPAPGTSRTKEVELCRNILQALNLRSFRPQVMSCPGCGRTTSTYFQNLTQDIEKHIKKRMLKWQYQFPEVKKMKVAVMGCIVNGPGESKHADIGISLPGTGESPVAPIFIDGKKTHTIRGNNIATQFMEILDNYVITRFG